MLHRLLNLPLRHQIGSVGDGNKLGRDTWLAKTLQSIPSGQRILDAGAGQLQYAGLCSHLRYVSQDFGQYDGTGNRVGLQVGDWDQSGVDIVCHALTETNSVNSCLVSSTPKSKSTSTFISNVLVVAIVRQTLPT